VRTGWTCYSAILGHSKIWTGSESRKILLTRRNSWMVALAIILNVAFHSDGEAVVNAAELAERTNMVHRTLEPFARISISG
jgi:hypothetical protein